MKDKIKALLESVHMSEECTKAIAYALDRSCESKDQQEVTEIQSS